jgi:hypothetical protein
METSILCKCCANVLPIDEFKSARGLIKKRCKKCRDKINQNNHKYLEKKGKINVGDRDEAYCHVCDKKFTAKNFIRHKNSVEHKRREYYSNNDNKKNEMVAI